MLKQNLIKMIDEEQINEIARETGFMKRKRVIQPFEFILSLVFHTAIKIPVSLRDIVSLIDKNVSRTAIHKKFTENSSLFFRKCLEYLTRQNVQSNKIESPLLDKFNNIVLADSTCW
ncbi:MAG: hypothetical protein GY754_25660, partial [bacterium]|nr:hypothetical protein [bacterium]